ncbi:CBS domain-containing protein [Actinomadura rugatobispora]|uniref:CBS domain-containing protein n=1 Tax=Actinomadura rugatobispora TaxID=1994 RepID=A0ABW1ABB8_9ACTN|nr:CBS domain-containing protein [Actinomadura rugatobispora]
METTVEKVMTTDVVTVPETASFKEIVEVLRHHRMHAVPVLDAEGGVSGIVSAEDLILKEADPTAAEGEHLLATRRRHREWRKCAAATAAELMTAPVHTIGPHVTVRDAAREMRHRRVGRLPVIDPRTGALTGIVTRSDLLRVYDRPDEEIRRDILAEISDRSIGPDPARLEITVEQGCAQVRGSVDLRSRIPTLMHDIRRVEGVVSAQSHLEWGTDDLITRHYPYM